VISFCCVAALLAVRMVEHATAVCKTYEDKADALRTEFLRRSMRRKSTPVRNLTAVILKISLLYLLFVFGVTHSEPNVSRHNNVFLFVLSQVDCRMITLSRHCGNSSRHDSVTRSLLLYSPISPLSFLQAVCPCCQSTEGNSIEGFKTKLEGEWAQKMGLFSCF